MAENFENDNPLSKKLNLIASKLPQSEISIKIDPL